ncbi:MAG: DNA methyltransferase [Acidobacteria bacterium RIFCSPLOWO2_02_FULL_59_13]|nr:MAG: DNA methyltransferase [Acidobacteria bacterium RIFCSPLOWO2_02_FULL_59_13]
MMLTPRDSVLHGDCRELLPQIAKDYFSVCITDPPYNYEFVGRDWDTKEIDRRIDRVQESRTLVKNIPYGSGLAGGVRNKRWYERVHQNILEYQQWCSEWGREVFRTLRPGAFVLVFNSTRTIAHVQVALEKAGFYARDILVYRRHAGIPKGLNVARKLQSLGDRDWETWKGWHSCLRNEWEAICLVQKPLVENYITTIRQYKVGLLHAEMNGAGFLSNIIDQVKKCDADNVEGHCTVKPLELMKYLVRLTIPDHDQHIVLDPFAGTGTTCLAAKELGHPFVGIEINSEYVEIARSRLSRSKCNTADTSQKYSLFTE